VHSSNLKPNAMRFGLSPDRLAGGLLVFLLHAAALWILLSHNVISLPVSAPTLFVSFIAPPAPPKKEVTRQPEAPKPAKSPDIEKPQPRQLVAETPVTAPAVYVAPPPPKATPVIEAPAAPLPTTPVALSGELSLVCPERTPPVYPPLSLRRGESGTAILHVELGEDGRVVSANIEASSGYARLDQAALSAVKTWHCQPPRRNGVAVRAVAKQPFKFILQGN
jgi:protein TonB